jgi:hypothetical protein
MRFQMRGKVTIDNLRSYPEPIVERLRRLLADGAEARLDPRRSNFYDVRDGSLVFYIHVTPKGKVLLLGAWPREGLESTVGEKELLAQPSF